MINYYKTLGLEDFATIEEIRTAHRKLSKRYHPDLNNGSKYYEEKFREIQHAYEQLRDPVTKESHDNLLRYQHYGYDRPDDESYNDTYEPPPYNPPSVEYVRPWWERFYLPQIATVSLTLLSSIWFNNGHSYKPFDNLGKPFRIGATKDEILKIAGAPARVAKGNDLEIWTYDSGIITLRNDTVVGYTSLSEEFNTRR